MLAGSCIVHVSSHIVQYLVQMMCSFIFWPLAAIMGVEIEDAFHVASLIGTKVFADELISFIDLVDMVCERQIKVTNQYHFTVMSFTICSSVFIAQKHRELQLTLLPDVA